MNYRYCGHRKLSRLAEEQRRPMNRPEVQLVTGGANTDPVIANKRFVILKHAAVLPEINSGENEIKRRNSALTSSSKTL